MGETAATYLQMAYRPCSDKKELDIICICDASFIHNVIITPTPMISAGGRMNTEYGPFSL